MTSTTIEIGGLSHSFGDLRVIDGLDVKVAAGEVLGVVGPSGCGKSTLLELICGLLEPTAGGLAVGGKRVAGDRLRQCAYMPQRDLLLPWLSAIDNASLAPRNRGASRADARTEATPLFERFGLAEFAQARPGELSGGMRQRVAFLRTLLAGKPVLLLDEPFASLDAITRAEMQEWLAAALRAEARTCVLVTHDVEEALYLCDRVVVLSARPAQAVSELRPAGPRAEDRTEAVTDSGFTGLREQALAALRRGAMSDAGLRILLPALVIVALLGVWEVAARTGVMADAFGINEAAQDLLVPAPSQIAESLWDDRDLLADHGWVTLKELLLGIAISIVLGVAFAIAMHLSDTLRRAFYPLLVASQTIPIVAIAPILVIWFGFGIGPTLAVIALICFFPVTVATLDGLQSVDPSAIRMMRTLDADRATILRRLEMPAALPFFFSGAKIAVAIAAIGAVFGEFVSANEGLGFLIKQAQAQLLTARVFAAVAVLSAFAIGLFALLSVLERRVAWWGTRELGMTRIEGGSVRTRSRLACAAALLAVVATAAGCGEKEEEIGASDAEPFELALDFYVNPDHAGIYAGLENGRFEEAGLDVRPRVPSDPAAPIRLVAAGQADLAISYEPEVMIARDQGQPVVAVAALVPTPLTSLISLPEARIADTADLRGKTLATAGIPYQQAFLDAILREEGIDPGDVKTQNVGLGLLPAVLSGRADAMLGGFRNVEGVDLAERGLRPRVVPMDELGIPTYDELVLVANSDAVEEDPESIRLFIAALESGTEDAIADPDAATDAVLAAGDGLDPKLTAAEIDATLPLLMPESKRPYGYMNPAEWEEFAGFLADEGVIQALPETEDVLTNELLPGQIPD